MYSAFIQLNCFETGEQNRQMLRSMLYHRNARRILHEGEQEAVAIEVAGRVEVVRI